MLGSWFYISWFTNKMHYYVQPNIPSSKIIESFNFSFDFQTLYKWHRDWDEERITHFVSWEIKCDKCIIVWCDAIITRLIFILAYMYYKYSPAYVVSLTIEISIVFKKGRMTAYVRAWHFRRASIIITSKLNNTILNTNSKSTKTIVPEKKHK